MLGIYKAVVQLPPFTGLSEDVVENSFYFTCASGASSTLTDVLAIQARVVAFFNTTPSGAPADLANYISASVSRTAGLTKTLVYHTAGPGVPAVWGSPVGTASWTLDPPLASQLPMAAEVAAVISFHGDLTDVPETQTNPSPPPAVIRPAARRRGRVYIGPLQVNAGAESVASKDGIPAAGFILALKGAGGDLLAGNTATYKWVVASKADNTTYEVTGGFVDNAFDSQRRRGRGPTSRSTF